MKLIFEGREDKINTIKRLNETWCKRNNVSIIEDSIKVIDEDAEIEALIKAEEAEKVKQPRARRTKEQMDKDNK